MSLILSNHEARAVLKAIEAGVHSGRVHFSHFEFDQLRLALEKIDATLPHYALAITYIAGREGVSVG